MTHKDKYIFLTGLFTGLQILIIVNYLSMNYYDDSKKLREFEEHAHVRPSISYVLNEFLYDLKRENTKPLEKRLEQIKKELKGLGFASQEYQSLVQEERKIYKELAEERRIYYSRMELPAFHVHKEKLEKYYEKMKLLEDMRRKQKSQNIRIQFYVIFAGLIIIVIAKFFLRKDQKETES